MPGCPTEAPPLQPGPKTLSEERRVDGVKARTEGPIEGRPSGWVDN